MRCQRRAEFACCSLLPRDLCMEHQGRRALRDTPLHRCTGSATARQLPPERGPASTLRGSHPKPDFWERAHLPCVYLRSEEGRSAAAAPGTRRRQRRSIVPDGLMRPPAGLVSLRIPTAAVQRLLTSSKRYT